MSSLAMEMTKAYFDTKGLRYTEAEKRDVLYIKFNGMDHCPGIEIIVYFDDDDETVAIRAFEVVKVPDDKKKEILRACNELNAQYRWAKFYLEDDMFVAVADDAIIDAAACGEEIHELVLRIMNIVDEGYPTLMKAIYA